MSTIQKLAELAKECYRKSWRHLAESRFESGCTPDVIIKAEAEYKAVVAENERLREALYILREHACLHSMNMRSETFSIRAQVDAALAHSQEVGNDN